MERWNGRRLGGNAWVRVAIAVAAVAVVTRAEASPKAEPPRATPSAPALPALGRPIELVDTDDEPGAIVFPARVPGARRLTVVLHGMCSEPERVCAHFAEQVTRTENLICPRAKLRCEGGGSIWPQVGFAAQIEAAVQRAKRALPEAVDETHGRTLIGYSLGAFRALELAQTSDTYPRVMLIGAKIQASARLLQKSQVERVLLSAGEWDMMHDHMQREVLRLQRRGVASAFLGLGKAGHLFTADFVHYLPSALYWLNGEAGAVD